MTTGALRQIDGGKANSDLDARIAAAFAKGAKSDQVVALIKDAQAAAGCRG